jgi:hypothetical protein
VELYGIEACEWWYVRVGGKGKRRRGEGGKVVCGRPNIGCVCTLIRSTHRPHAHHVSPLLIPSKTKIAEWMGVCPAAGLARPAATTALDPSTQAGHQRNRRRRAPGTRRPRSPELQVHGSERAPDSTMKSPKEKTDASTTGSEAETTPDRTRLFCPPH